MWETKEDCLRGTGKVNPAERMQCKGVGRQSRKREDLRMYQEAGEQPPCHSSLMLRLGLAGVGAVMARQPQG